MARKNPTKKSLTTNKTTDEHGQPSDPAYSSDEEYKDPVPPKTKTVSELNKKWIAAILNADTSLPGMKEFVDGIAPMFVEEEISTGIIDMTCRQAQSKQKKILEKMESDFNNLKDKCDDHEINIEQVHNYREMLNNER